METKIILKDTLIGADYSLKMVNSRELSKILRSGLEHKSIDYKKFNDDLYKYGKVEYGETEMDIPVEVYEYQNFFLLEKENGELILLDGFRRLLWNETVSHDILVRVYKDVDMTTEKILKLLVSLNHTKFFGGIGSFYDRGFALALKTIFNIDISKIYNSFNGYLTVDKPKYEYSVSRLTRDDAHKSTIEKVISTSFIDDMKFLEALQETNVVDMDDVFGSYISHLRESNPDVILDATDFVSKINKNPLLVKQIKSFKKARDSRGNDIGNKMFEMFTNILLNKEGVKSFVERQAETKSIVEAMKKDKTLFCFTGNKKLKSYNNSSNKTKDNKGINAIISDYRKEHGFFPKVKVVVMPSENGLLEEGVYEDFEIKGFKSDSHLMARWETLVIRKGDIILGGGNSNDRYELSNISSYENFKYSKNDIYLFIENIFV